MTIFPFEIPEHKIAHYLKGDSDYINSFNDVAAGAEVLEIVISGLVQENKTLEMSGWMIGTSDLLGLMAGRFWQKTIPLTDDEVNHLVQEQPC